MYGTGRRKLLYWKCDDIINSADSKHVTQVP